MNLRDALGVSLIGGFLLALGVLFFKAIPQSNEQLIVYMLGQLSGFAGGIVAYHYTLSKQSEKATENTGDAFKAIAAAAASRPADDGPTGNAGDPLHTVEEESGPRGSAALE
ncbi:hypothetical protein [Sphingomonas japonica]|uniref:XapX domain-containing protein n=1 Tax=Sphingomonas japonica TaxID=511662 RepID=A0ABX0U598_9SPHN|nr:hypothetical protein [Sphingomonas japonica]NIJ24846.1 hypothetical protein [Sphingomonas japonica]